MIGLIPAALIALGAGIAYGLLRLTGLIRFPGDNTYSINYLNASWRDDGARVLVACCGPFAGILVALRSFWARRPEAGTGKERK